MSLKSGPGFETTTCMETKRAVPQIRKPNLMPS
jgi:hypothetical protein